MTYDPAPDIRIIELLVMFKFAGRPDTLKGNVRGAVVVTFKYCTGLAEDEHVLLQPTCAPPGEHVQKEVAAAENPLSPAAAALAVFCIPA